MSSTDSSPMRFGSSGSDLNFVGTAADPSFTAEISNKMRVPRKIRVGDAGESDDANMGWGRPSLGVSSEKYAMQVPDRIIVTGQDQHKGTKALPRELQLESTSMPLPPDPEMIRIQTPPRQITLMNSRPESYMSTDPEDGDDTLIVENDRARFGNEVLPNGTVMMYQERNSLSRKHKIDSTLMNQGDLNEEVVHLREQLSRMNRRVLALEEDTTDRKERERYMVMMGLLYVAFKAVTWLFRSGNQN